MNEQKRSSETKMEMTPMIDVTFLLLVFFLCTIQFKLLEGKIPSFLPKGEGVNTSRLEEQLERLEISVLRKLDVDATDPGWVWHENQIEIRINGQAMSGLEEFHDRIRQARASDPEAKATIRPGHRSLYIDSVKVVNECIRADFTDLTFRGIPMDA